MSHSIQRVSAVSLLGPHRLLVSFDDGTSQDIDFEPILRGELYGPLRDPEFFARVTIDPEVHTLVWPNGADFDPTTLHDWPKHAPSMKRLAEGWTSAEVGGSQTRSA